VLDQLLARRELMRATPGTSAEELAEIERAIAWIRAGAGGRCVVCYGLLPAAKLERDPLAKVCDDCVVAPGSPGWWSVNSAPVRARRR
jgi:RNA polymerase-binding transcription factor DksA